MSNHLKLGIVAAALIVALVLAHPAIALLLAMVVNLALEPQTPDVTRKLGKFLLQAAIVLLGFSLNAQALWSVSQDYAGLILLYVLLTLVAGLGLGRLFSVHRDESILLSSGTAICGGTTIATLAPVIRARPESVAMCLTIVFLLNALAIFTLPAVGHYLELTQHQFGVWVALAIHDTSSVVGAAALFGDEALEVASTVKLARTLLLIPLVLFAGLYMQRGDAKARIPGFVLLFVLGSIVGTTIGLSADWIQMIKLTSRLLLVGALFFVGLEINRQTLRQMNGRAVVLAVSLWLLVLPITLYAVLHW